MTMRRRTFIKGLSAGVGLGLVRCANGLQRVPPVVGERYPGWMPGELDIHFIQTGVGEQTFFTHHLDQLSLLNNLNFICIRVLRPHWQML